MIPNQRQARGMDSRSMSWPSFGEAPTPGQTENMIIPYDHAATFELKGRPGNIVQDVINVGSDGVFVDTAIGYGFEEQRARPINNPVGVALATDPAVIPGKVTLDQLPLTSLIEGFRISPRFA